MERSEQNGHGRAGSEPGGAGGVRLQRVLAEAGVASRRACEAMIEAGDVEVNGEVVDRLPVFVDPRKDRISVRGQPVKVSVHERPGRPGGGKVYVLLHKPDNCLVTTADDEPVEGEEKREGRRTVMDLVDHPSGARLFPVGRLDFHSSGLVLLTNDGELAHRLTHAKYGVKKVYRVAVKHRPTDEVLDALRRMVCPRPPAPTHPLSGAEPVAMPDPLRVVGETDAGLALEIVAREGKTRSLRDVLARLGLKVRKITRVRIGPLSLIGVRSATWRDLSPEEVTDLRAAVGLGGAGAGAGARKSRRKGGGTAGQRIGGKGKPGRRGIPQRLAPPTDSPRGGRRAPRRRR